MLENLNVHNIDLNIFVLQTGIYTKFIQFDFIFIISMSNLSKHMLQSIVHI